MAGGGGQGGAWFSDDQGRQWFGKGYGGNVDRLEGENLGSKIYREMGLSAPETHIGEVNGKPVLLSRELPGVHAQNTPVLKGPNLMDGFVVDAWLGNRDVIGTGKDNILVAGDKAHRIDAGGATIWRATGANKTFAAKVGELESMRDASREAGRLFGTLSDEQVQAQLEDFVSKYETRRPAIDKLIDES